MIRCDDVFVDSDVDQFRKICQLIRLYGFDHLIGVTPLGQGKKLWKDDSRKSALIWKLPILRSFVNYRIDRICGEKYIGDNRRLIEILDTEFKKYEAIPALHGLHHYKYDLLPKNRVHKELSTGTELYEKLFHLRVEVFTPPFGASNHQTELVCRNLNLSVDKCVTSFDKSLCNESDAHIRQLAKLHSSIPEVRYHPYRLTNMNKFELYLKTRRKYC
jgi:hypothetical protein